MMRKLSIVLFLMCFLAAVSASAKVCFLPNVFGGDNDCLIGISGGSDDTNDNGGGGDEPDPNNPCGPNAVSEFLTGEHTGLFAYYETAYGAGCYIVGCSGLYGSTSSPQLLNTSVFTISSATYGGVTCHYATGCREPYKRECSDGASVSRYDLDSLTCYQCDEPTDCPTANSCAGYTVKSAPANGSLDGAPCQVVNSDCSNGDLLYKFKCNEGYEPQGTTCVAKECQGAYATEASKCASTGTCNGTWSIGLSTNGRSGDKYCYNCVCTGAQTCDVVTCGAEVSVPNNATCSKTCTPVDASCNTGTERCTEWTCNTGYKKSGSGCVQKTCGDYSPYIYDSCTNKECDSQTCSSAPQAVGSGTKTCFTAPSGSCTVSCDTNPCYGYDTYTKPANSHWTSEACRYKYVSGTSCIDGGDWYEGWECNSGYTRSGSSCIELTPEEPTVSTCETRSCSDFSRSSCPTGANCDDCQIQNADCTLGDTKYKITSCKDGYKESSGSCAAMTCGDYDWKATSCSSGYVETKHENTKLGSSSKTCYECTAITSCGYFSDYPYDGCNKECDSQTCSSGYKYLRRNGSTLSYEKCYSAPSGDCNVAKTCASEHPTDGTKNQPDSSYYTYSTDNTVSDGPCYYNISAKSCSEVHSGGTTNKPGNGWTYSEDTVNGGPCYYNKVAKDCAGDYPYTECTGKECDSQTCASTTIDSGDSTKTCYKAPTGSCTTCADIGQWDSESACESANTCADCSRDNATGCFKPVGCSSSCLTGITLQSFYSYNSYTYNSKKCYTVNGCASGWQSSTCSGYSTTGWKSAHSLSTKCTQCDTCTYSSQLACEKDYWNCSSTTEGTSPMTATCWNGSCERDDFTYEENGVRGAEYDDRDCCLTTVNGTKKSMCNGFLCDNSKGYIKSGTKPNETCVCNTAAGWSQNADGTCYCGKGNAVNELGECVIVNETVCPKTVTDAYAAIMNWSLHYNSCRAAITAFCTLYTENYNKCKALYPEIKSSGCTVDKLEAVMCEQSRDEL